MRLGVQLRLFLSRWEGRVSRQCISLSTSAYANAMPWPMVCCISFFSWEVFGWGLNKKARCGKTFTQPFPLLNRLKVYELPSFLKSLCYKIKGFFLKRLTYLVVVSLLLLLSFFDFLAVLAKVRSDFFISAS